MICAAVTTELRAFYRALLAQHGFPYVWPTASNRYSGKGLEGCLFPDGRDCSGAVTYALRRGGFEDVRATCNTAVMWSTWAPVNSENALPGDVVLYANRKTGKVEHVMTLCEDGRVFGADGAGSNCTDPSIAVRLGASVRFRDRIDYRGAPMGFRVNPLRRGAQ